MRILEIENPNEMRPILEQISLSTRSMPSLIMFGATSKVVLFLVINFFVISVFSRAVWQVCSENESVIRTTTRAIKAKPKVVKKVPPADHDMKVEVTQVEPADERTQGQSTYDSQPPFNPYLTNNKSNETHF